MYNRAPNPDNRDVPDATQGAYSESFFDMNNMLIAQRIGGRMFYMHPSRLMPRTGCPQRTGGPSQGLHELVQPDLACAHSQLP
jgi:hypothetical protein